jgi:hypothetical protein
MALTRLITCVLTLTLMTALLAVAQNKRVLTTADYDRATKMLAPNLNGLVVGGNADATWLPDGRFWYVRTTLSGMENVVINPAGKMREVVAVAGALAAPAVAVEAAAVSRSPKPVGPTLPERLRGQRLQCRQTAAKVSSSAIGIFGCAMSRPVRTAS